MMEILLDENVENKEDIDALGIQVGDIIAMDPRTVITESGYIKSRFLDDKLSGSNPAGTGEGSERRRDYTAS